jgi:hypothetical protein
MPLEIAAHAIKPGILNQSIPVLKFEEQKLLNVAMDRGNLILCTLFFAKSAAILFTEIRKHAIDRILRNSVLLYPRAFQNYIMVNQGALGKE